MTTLNPRKLAIAILAPTALVTGMVVGARIALLRKKAATLAVREAALKEEMAAPAKAPFEGGEEPGETLSEEVVAPEEAFEADDLATS